ncbi:ABC-2 type transport system ATP-binding protein [Methanocalculus alkaliphilus]|uniref:ATP-binding cassette domain-containing protein n=1 Tax=Methanocalculus alkaliphilus TaxID=768730 RepID=UPI00209F7551|nr:ATP-binding cassette domain-containing protein [Methanocalculus alkaliphilus]MCP1715344.1 ABC-2 type transport system ATP-binding protein [Methanocalculus alkaliphilus]
MPAVLVEGLTKRFGDFTAVDAISFEIEKGEIFGLLGPNGAGKTTAISMLSTLLEPTSGRASLNGIDIQNDQDGVRKAIGVVFQDQSLDEELTAWENMDFHGRLYRIPKVLREERIRAMLRLVELEDRQESLVKTFSGGMRRRLEIARGLLHEPSVLFLDEPTLGLDPQTRNHLWEYIRNLNRTKGITIILTTHYMDEADRLCDRVAIIDRGRIVAMDSPATLKSMVGEDVVSITSPDAGRIADDITAPWILGAEQYDGQVIIRVRSAEDHLLDLLGLIGRDGYTIASISIRKPTLEDVFLHYTGREMRQEEAGAVDRMRMMMPRRN